MTLQTRADIDTSCSQPVLHPRLLPDSALADLVFLESWERDPAPGPAALRRVMQIRRANPELAAAIRQRCTG